MMFEFLLGLLRGIMSDNNEEQVEERWQVPTDDENFHPYVRPQTGEAVDDSDTGPSGLVRPREMKFVSKRWGWELWICNNEKYCGKILFLKAGHHLSYHHHEVKDEVLYVQQGRMWMSYGDEPPRDTERVNWCEMPVGHAFHVRPGLKHQMQAIEDTYIIEFSTQHFDDDSFRTTTDLVVNHETDRDEWMR
jgi:mannose-6-phosphate isomerase-like protein (cupin superfamily)